MPYRTTRKCFNTITTECSTLPPWSALLLLLPVIMDSSYTTHIVLQNKNSKPLTRHTQVDKHRRTNHIFTGMVSISLWIGLSKHERLELGFVELWQSGQMTQTSTQRIPDRGGNETERALTRRFKLRLGTFKSLSLEGGRVRAVWYVKGEAQSEHGNALSKWRCGLYSTTTIKYCTTSSASVNQNLIP